jgi:hypothetical protein
MTATRILSFDPSSSKIGYAYAFINESNKFYGLKADYLSPFRQKDPPRKRTDYMVKSACAIMDEILQGAKLNNQELLVLVEVTSGKVNHNRHGGGGAGLATYGDAVGCLRTALAYTLEARAWPSHNLVLLEENDWIGGFSKEKRQTVALRYFPDLVHIKDAGNDASDAAAMAYKYYVDNFLKGGVK